MIRVALIDDQPLFRGGIAMMVASQDDMEVVAEAATGSEVLALVRRHRPDVVVMDVRMPGTDGITATAELHTALGDDTPKVLVLTTFDVDEAAASAIEAGASGFVLKDAQPEFLLAAIRAVYAGNQVVAASATRRIFESFRPRSGSGPGPEYERLTPREREILVMVARGLANAEIAAEAVLSEATVKTHVSRILNKLELRDRVQLVVYAYRTSLV